MTRPISVTGALAWAAETGWKPPEVPDPWVKVRMALDDVRSAIRHLTDATADQHDRCGTAYPGLLLRGQLAILRTAEADLIYRLCETAAQPSHGPEGGWDARCPGSKGISAWARFEHDARAMAERIARARYAQFEDAAPKEAP